MLKAIAIDDEPVALEVIRVLASKISFIDITGYFTNAYDALQYLQQQPVDLIFIDIKMPDISGIDFLKLVQRPPMVIFTTAYSEHAVQSFELNAIDYLLKPFSQARFLQACNKAYEQFRLRNQNSHPPAPAHVFIRSGTGQVRIDLDTILYIESQGNYMQFVLENKKVLSRLTMSETEALLPAGRFIRIHRSYIVAKNKLTRIEKSSVWIHHTELPVGKNYIHELERIIQ
jgi:DNA-binding LytR/AlgR family response regulator